MANQTSPAIATSLTAPGNNYYLQVFALTAQETPSTGASTTDEYSTVVPSGNAYMVWLPFLVFFSLFVAAFGILIINRIRNWKRIAGALVLAFCLASIPFVISAINGGFSTQNRATPEERPRRVEIQKLPDNAALVTWDTDSQTTGALRYGEIPLNEKSTVLVADNGNKTNQHTVKISDLSSGKTYGVVIFSQSIWYDNQGKILEFKVN